MALDIAQFYESFHHILEKGREREGSDIRHESSKTINPTCHDVFNSTLFACGSKDSEKANFI